MDPHQRNRARPVQSHPEHLDATVEGTWHAFVRVVLGRWTTFEIEAESRDGVVVSGSAPVCLDEFAFRFNNRKNPNLFRDTITRLVRAEALPYENSPLVPKRSSVNGHLATIRKIALERLAENSEPTRLCLNEPLQVIR